MEVHCNDMMYAGNRQKICNQPSSNRAAMRLLFRLAGVREVSC